MRRKDRELADRTKIDEIIMECDCCRLAFADEICPYIVPMNFGYSDGVFYFHSAKEGRKIELIKKNGHAGFELDCGHRLDLSDKGCGCSFAFKSVIGEGKVSFITDNQEKIKALNILMEHYSGRSDWEFSKTTVGETCIFKLEISRIACKEHK